MSEEKSEAGIAYVAAAAILLMVFTAVYTVYQAFGVPGVCKDFEGRSLSDFIEGAKELAAVQKEVIGTGRPAGVEVRSHYTYPVIPFFMTPTYLSVSTGLYDISVTLENVESSEVFAEVDISHTLTLSGKGVWMEFGALFSSPVRAFVELGLVATDGSYITGSVVEDGEIYLPFFDGSKTTSQLYPLSAGGKGIVVRPAGPGNITLRIEGSKIPQRVWELYANERSLNVSFSGDTVVISLPPANYTLFSGVASFGEGRENKASYLVARTPLNQRSPAVIDVEALDDYLNPVSAEINLRCVAGCPVEVCTPTPSGLDCSSIGSKSYYADEVSVVARKSTPGIAVVVASVKRAAGGSYQIAFSITST